MFEKFGIEVESQRLVYMGKDLQTKKNFRDMTFSDYNIRGGSNIVLVVRLNGGLCNSSL